MPIEFVTSPVDRFIGGAGFRVTDSLVSNDVAGRHKVNCVWELRLNMFLTICERDSLDGDSE